MSGTMTVGREVQNQIVLEDDSVSRRHAQLELIGNEIVLRDLGSANGTAVNGEVLEGDRELVLGDVIQFGLVEAMFEARSPPLPVAKPRPRDLPRRADIEDEAPAIARRVPPSADLDRRRALIVGASVGSLVLLATVVLVAAVRSGRSGPPAEKRSQPRIEVDPIEQIDALLTECRTYSSPEVGQPDWGRAKTACEKVLEIEPIHADANALLRRIEIEKACEDNLRNGKELISAGRLEEGVEAYAKVGAKEGDCPTYYLRVLDLAADPVGELKARAGADCREYARNGKWENAYRRCELYMRLACQTMSQDELLPPPGSVLRLEGRAGRGEWRPADPLYVDFLRARQRLKPSEPMWRCPKLLAFRPPPKVKSQDETILKDFKERYHSEDIGVAVFQYFKGKEGEARVPLQKILESMSRADEHERTRAILQDISMAQSYLNKGMAELTNEHPDRAADPFRKALEVDEHLVLGGRAGALSPEQKRIELDRRTSYLRRTITDEMTKACYRRGKFSADRRDFRQACRFWKLGGEFGRSNIDLLRALTNVCTDRAREEVQRASSCVELKQALDFAVDGDGYRQQAEQKMDELGCPGAR